MPLFKTCAHPPKCAATSGKKPLTLQYFDLPARAQTIRLMLRIGSIDFVDQRFAFSEWPAHKPNTPLGQLPVLVLEDGVTQIPQSVAILQYIADRIGWTPSCPVEGAKVLSVVHTIQDAMFSFSVWFATPDAEKEAIKPRLTEKFTEGIKALNTYVGKMQKDGFCIGNGKDTLADAMIANLVYTPASEGLPQPFDAHAIVKEHGSALQTIADRFKKSHEAAWKQVKPAYRE